MNANDGVTLEQIVDEFLERKRIGERPSIEEYATRYPHLGDEMSRALRALSLMEQLKPDDGSCSSSAHWDSIPDRVGEYRILREIGRGGMGVVYEAVQESLARPVALKVMPNHASNERSLARFEREARAAARLHHTNIVPVYDIGQDGDNAYFAMQLIEGQGLDIVIDELRRLRHPRRDESGVESIEQAEIDGSSRPQPQPRNEADASPTCLARSVVSGRFQYEDFLESMGRSPRRSDGAQSDSTTTSGRSILSDESCLSVPDWEPDATSPTPSKSFASSNPRQFFHSVAHIGLQAADALSYAHARGIVHRDVKPSNLLLDRTGVVWVTDFGLAKTDEDAMTRTGEILGTIRYMSPERFSGECDERSDIYALGITLYELLVGRPAFESSDRLHLVDMIHKVNPPSPRSLDRRVPHDLETIVLKAIDKNPKSRYVRADELANDLQRFMDDAPIRARRASTSERLFRWARRNKSLAVLLSTVVLLLSLLAAVSTVAWIRNAKQLQLAQENLYLADVNLAGQTAAEPYGADTIKAKLSRWLPKEAGADLRGWEWYYLYSLVHREHFTSDKLGGVVWSVDWSPDGTRFVASINNFGWKMWDAATGEPIQQQEAPRILFVAWSPDGRRLASTNFNGKVDIWNASTGQRIQQFRAHADTRVQSVAWSPDGSRLATSSHTTGEVPMLRVWDAQSGEEIRSLDGHTDSVAVVAWSPDAARLASTSHDDTTRIWDVTTGEELAQFATPIDGMGSPVYPLCWSLDGTKLLTATNDTTVQIWDVATSKELATLAANAGYVFNMSWRPNSNQLATAHGDGSVRLWDAAAARQLHRFYGHTHEARYVKWSQDGDLLISASLDHTVRVWDVENRNPDTIIRQEPWPSHDDWRRADHRVAWNSRGDRLVTATAGNVVLWDSRTGNGRVLQRDPSAIVAVAWSPDDGRIAFGGEFTPFQVWNSATDEITPREETSDWGISAVAWNHKGNRLATGSDSGDVAIWNMDTNTKMAVIKDAHEGAVFSVDWHHDGTRLATVGWGFEAKVWDPATSELIWQTQASSGKMHTARWSHDGTILATTQNGAVVLWNGSTGVEIGRLEEIDEDFRTLDWSPDSKQLATGSLNSVSLWDVSSRRVALRWPNRLPKVHCVRWSRDGTRLAVVDEGGTIRVRDATIGYRSQRRR